MIRAICGRIFGCAHSRAPKEETMSAEEAFYKRHSSYVDPAAPPKLKPEDPGYTPKKWPKPTPEERADIEKYLHLKPGVESDDVIAFIIDSGL